MYRFEEDNYLEEKGIFLRFCFVSSGQSLDVGQCGDVRETERKEEEKAWSATEAGKERKKERRKSKENETETKKGENSEKQKSERVNDKEIERERESEEES